MLAGQVVNYCVDSAEIYGKGGSQILFEQEKKKKE
jgi:hypothetical protein